MTGLCPPSSSPVRLSVVDSWTGSRSPGSPPVFLDNGSRPVAPAFPRTGPGEPSSPPSAVLCRRYDFLFTHPRSLICFACGVHADLLGSCLASSRSRQDGGCPPGRGVCSAGYPMPACSHVGAMGSRRFPGDPSCAFAPLQDPGRTTDPSPWRYRRCCPRTTHSEGFSASIISRLLRGFGTCCLRFTTGVAARHARLASGWLADLYREGVEPSGSR
jgi:hypothetical protein